jgi:hypothetical protein
VQDYSRPEGSEISRQTLTLPFTIENSWSDIELVGTWSANRNVVGASLDGAALLLSCEQSYDIARSKRATGSIYLGHTLLAGSVEQAIGDSVPACRVMPKVTAGSISDAVVREYPGALDATAGLFAKSGSLSAGKNELQLVAGISSANSKDLYFSRSEVFLKTLVVLERKR